MTPTPPTGPGVEPAGSGARNERAPAWPLELVAALKDGASLASVMIPDPNLPTNAPEYLESYAFDHVVVSERCFWALPRPIAEDWTKPEFKAFAYCGDPRLFLSYAFASWTRPGGLVELSYYPGDAYKHFEYVVHHDHARVYDSAQPERADALDHALRTGASLRVVMEDEGGLTHVLPVQSCVLERRSGTVQVTTALRHAPELCFCPVEALWPHYARLMEAIEAANPPARSRTALSLVSGVKESTRALRVLADETRLRTRMPTLHSSGYCDDWNMEGERERLPIRGFRLHAHDAARSP